MTLTTEQMQKMKTSLRTVTTDESLETEIDDLAAAFLADIGIAGITEQSLDVPLIWRAATTYVRMNFGQSDDYDRLKKSYDEQKAQLQMATGYTTWTEQ